VNVLPLDHEAIMEKVRKHDRLEYNYESKEESEEEESKL
jgi:hypothetical protein